MVALLWTCVFALGAWIAVQVQPDEPGRHLDSGADEQAPARRDVERSDGLIPIEPLPTPPPDAPKRA